MKRVAAAILLSLFSAFAAAQSRTTHQAAGTVRAVDAAKGTISLAHGPVPSMSWPAMTMTFKTKDKNLLQGVKPGQKVQFDFQQQGRDYVVISVKQP